MSAPPMPSLPTPLHRVVACLAQAEAAGEGRGDRPEAPFALQYLPLIAIAAAAYLLLFRPERERMRKQQELLSSLKKNDRVVTSSGICGTVASVDRDAERVTLKVDEASNARLTVTLSSVARVLREGGGPDEGEPG